MTDEHNNDDDMKIDPEEAVLIVEKGANLFKDFGSIQLAEKPDMDVACLTTFVVNMMIVRLGFPLEVADSDQCNSLLKIAMRAAYNKGKQDATVP